MCGSTQGALPRNDERERKMSYNTRFDGAFAIAPALADDHHEYLTQFAQTMRVRRDAQKASKIRDRARSRVGLPVGPDGAYVVGANWDPIRIGPQDASVVDGSRPPTGQPSQGCQWTPNDDGTALEWNGEGGFYKYVEWMEYLIEHFLKPWGYEVNGQVGWRGEDFDDVGVVVVAKNNVFARRIAMPNVG
jgi:hypothetical protein